jgi:FkbM family methyltransferase
MFFYNLKQTIRDLILKMGNPLKLMNFSPQHQKLIELGPYDQVLHIGANSGQEFSLYDYIGLKSAIWVEPEAAALRKLKRKSLLYRNIKSSYVNEFISEVTGIKVNFYKFNKSGANSTFKPTEIWLKENRDRWVTELSTVTTITIEDAMKKHDIKVEGGNNLLVIDVQGNELSVLNGFSSFLLNKFRVIMCEFSQGQYENSTLPMDLKLKLEKLGYIEILAPIRKSDDAVFLRNNGESEITQIKT